MTLNEQLLKVVESGDYEKFKELFNNSCKLNPENTPTFSPTLLNEAAGCGHIKIVKFLIEKGAKLDARDKYENTPLHCATSGGHNEIIKLLVEKGADVNARNYIFATPC